ncbi:MAG: hypothetical protein IKA65_06190 [Lentisphaeria bacterium]|nr:hypothetical protein [Lentisphaeria bacterium]
MKKHFLLLYLLLTVFLLPAAVKLSDFRPGKTPGAKALKFSARGEVLVMNFATGNSGKSRGWMRQYAPWMQAGEQLKITVEAQANMVKDPRAKVFLLVQALGENHKNLRSRTYSVEEPAAKFNGKWQTVEFIFAMPDPNRARNWKDGKELMINFGAASLDGIFEFRNLRFSKVAVPAVAQDSLLTAAQSWRLTELARKNPDFVYQVKLPTGKNMREWSFELPPCEDINGYVPTLSFDFVLQKNAAQIQPQLAVNGKKLARLDHRHLPRLLNAKNASDGGSKTYIYSLKKCFQLDRNNQIVITSGSGGRFMLKNVKLFFTPEIRPLYPDAPQVRKNAFTILPGKAVKVLLDGKEFLREDRITGVKDIAALPDRACTVDKESGAIKTHNLVQLGDPTVDFRREVRIMENGELEIFMRSIYKKTDTGKVSYTLSLPAELFDGADYELRYGHRNKYNSVKGKVNINIKNANKNLFYHAKNNAPVTHIHYLYLQKNGMKLVFDFSPLSVSGQINPYCQEPQKILNFIYKRGDRIIFDFGKRPNPEYYSFFVRIHAGEYDHFYRHGNTVTFYPSGPYLENLGYHISFADKKGTEKLNKSLYDFPWWLDIYQMPFQSANILQNQRDLLFHGWTMQAIGSKTYQTKGKLPGSMVFFAPQGKSVYSVPLEPGIYMGSLTIGHTDRAVEELTVKCNGEVVAENVSVQANHFRQIFFSVYVKSPAKHAVLEFDGKNYAVNQLVLRNTITEAEDYVWKNRYWRKQGLPTFPLAVNPDKLTDDRLEPEPPAVMGKMVTENIPQDGVYANAGKNIYPEPPFPPLANQEKWAWNICATHIGGGNNESGMVFRPTGEFRQFRRRIKAAGYNAVMEQGLFWNLCYSNKARKEHIANLKALAKIIHEEGLKLIRHADGPSFNTIFRGAYATAEAAGWFPVDLGTLKSFQGAACISNPYLRNHVISILEEYVRETQCDILMIDELYILRTGARCACVYCRKKFAEDTRYTLPMPDDQAQLFTPGNQLNALWMDWKMRQDGNFFREMKERITKVNPQVLITSYGVDFQHPIGRFQTLAPYLDVVGIEGTNHYLFANYRHLLSCRKLQAAFADEYGHSQWHIFNRDNSLTDMPLVRYIYRAFNSLNRSGVITYIGHPILENTHMEWNWLDFRNQQPIADVGVFHRYDAYYRPDKPYLAGEQFGISQLLSDKHIPHEFITRLTHRRLSKFKLVILGNATILSNAEIAALKEYVKNGGKLLITGTFGTFDNKFVPQNSSRYIDLTGVEFLSGDLPEADQYTFTGKKIKTRRAAIKNISGRVLAKAADGTPLLISRKSGKGMVLTTPLTPGMAAFENIIIRGKAYVKVNTQEGSVVLDELLKQTGHTRYPVMLAGASHKVIMESSRNTQSGTINIQLLNLNIPLQLVPGKVPGRLSKKDVKFLPPAEPLKITLQEKVKSAAAISPDYPEKHDLPVKTLPDGSSQITLQPEMLKIYTRIIVEK